MLLESDVAWTAAISEKFLSLCQVHFSCVLLEITCFLLFFFYISLSKYFQNFLCFQTCCISKANKIYLFLLWKWNYHMRNSETIVGVRGGFATSFSGQIYTTEHPRNLAVILAAVLILRSRSLGINMLVWYWMPDFRWFVKENQLSTFSCLLQILDNDCKRMQFCLSSLYKGYFLCLIGETCSRSNDTCP